MASRDLPVVLPIQSDRIRELFAMNRAHDLIESGPEQPSAARIQPMGDPQRLDFPQIIFQPFVVIPNIEKLPPNHCGVHSPTLHHLKKISAGECQHDGAKRVVDRPGQARHESTQARPLQTDRPGDQR